MRFRARHVAAIVLVCVVVQHGPAARGEVYKWWRDPAIQQELELTADQVKSLEAFFASTLAEQRELGKALDRLEKSLQQSIAVADFDEATLKPVVDELEAMRAKRNTTRTLMLFRMYRTLSPEQRQRLRELQKRSERSRHPPGASQ